MKKHSNLIAKTACFLAFQFMSLLVIHSYAQIEKGNNTVEKRVASLTPKKWFPGQYLMVDENDFDAKSKGWTILKDPTLGKLFNGVYLYVTWGKIETGLNTYNWDNIDKLLNALPTGKKIAMSLAWQAWHGTNAPCPSDMIDDKTTGLYRGGFYSFNASYSNLVIRKSTFYLTSTMNRYLAFMKKFAEKYDTDPRIAFIITGEFAGTDQREQPGYNADTLLANINRIPQIPGYFQHTPSGVLGDWWPYGGTITAFMTKVLNAGGGYGAPDIHKDATNITPFLYENKGKLPVWHGMEWNDLKEFAIAPFPSAHLNIATAYKNNFIWWNTANRSKETPPGYDFNTDVVNYLKQYPLAGISTTCPENIICEQYTAINDTKLTEINVSPNPVADILKINGDIENTTVTLANISGKVVYLQENVGNRLDIPVSNFPNGMYLLKIESNKNTVAKKFIKKEI